MSWVVHIPRKCAFNPSKIFNVDDLIFKKQQLGNHFENNKIITYICLFIMNLLCVYDVLDIKIPFISCKIKQIYTPK